MKLPCYLLFHRLQKDTVTVHMVAANIKIAINSTVMTITGL